MRKKLLALMMAGLVLGMSACASAEKNPVDTEQVQSGQEETEEEESGDEATQKEEEKKPQATSKPEKEDTVPNDEDELSEEALPKYLQVSFDYNYDGYYNERSFMQGHYETINLHNKEYAALSEAVDAFNLAHSQASQSYLDELQQYAVEDFQEYGEESFFGPYEYNNDLILRRADRQVLSVVSDNYEYTGGAHGGRYFSALNFDVQTGEQITLEQVITDKNLLCQALAVELSEKYWEFEFEEDYWLGILENYVTDEPIEFKPEFTWTVEYDGVSFYFGNYELVSYAGGTQEITIHYSEYPDILNSSYFDTVEKTYVKDLTGEQWNAYVDIDSDGQADSLSVTTQYDDQYYCIESYTVKVNNSAYTFDTHAYQLETYLVKAGEENYLYVEQSAENDYKTVAVYKIAPDGVEYVDQFEGGMWAFTNSESFKVIRRMDLLGTYSVQVDCRLGENGLPQETSKVFDISGMMTIYSTKEITADLVDKNGKLLGESYTFPVGSAFTFKRTDGITFVDMQTDFDQYCRFYVTPGWPVTVNGINAEECFEELFYAG